MPRNIFEQLEIGRSQTTTIGKEGTIHSSVENISCPISVQVFVEPLTSEEQFKLKYGRSVGRSASVSNVSITEICEADTSTKETKGMDSIETTMSLES